MGPLDAGVNRLSHRAARDRAPQHALVMRSCYKKDMLLTTTAVIDGRQIVKYHGLVSGEAILGANIFRDLFAGIRDIVGGRSAAYEKELRRAKDLAIQEMTEQALAMGANAIVGIDLDYETVGQGGSMLMVSANGTAVSYS
jgi:uncharacterized protein YbjQ (UPF0145 family)